MLSKLLIEAAVPIACAWAKKQEAVILQTGELLSDAQLADARRIGIAQPESVKVMRVATVPPQLHPALRKLAMKFGLTFSGTAGMALGHGIFLRVDHSGNRALLLHELVHVAQYERLGLRPFLRQYLHECFTSGYPHGALEAEAREVTETLCA